jgi:hypothetical protein
VHLFRPSPSLLAEAQPRLENRREQRVLFITKGTFYYKEKDIIGKITNLLCIYLFQINKFINRYILYNIFLQYLLSACQQN